MILSLLILKSFRKKYDRKREMNSTFYLLLLFLVYSVFLYHDNRYLLNIHYSFVFKLYLIELLILFSTILIIQYIRYSVKTEFKFPFIHGFLFFLVIHLITPVFYRVRGGAFEALCITVDLFLSLTYCIAIVIFFLKRVGIPLAKEMKFIIIGLSILIVTSCLEIFFSFDHAYLLNLISIIFFIYFISNDYNKDYRQLLQLESDIEGRIDEKTKELNDTIIEISRNKDFIKTLFSSIIHEIRTPFTLILNHFENYRSGVADSKDLQRISENLSSLQNYISTYLDIVKMENGTISKGKRSGINISEILRKRIIMFSDVAERNGIELNPRIENDLSILANHYEMEQIINNLLDNAIKFSFRNGRVDITLGRSEKGIVLGVKDYGAGAPRRNLDSLLMPFTVDTSSEGPNGTGLGLYIVKDITDSLGARLVLEGDLGRGLSVETVFKEYSGVPEGRSEKSSRYLEKSSGTAADKEIRLLLVEDNRELLDLFYESLNEIYDVSLAENGKEALDLIESGKRFDLIISDVIMDVMNGYAFFEKVRNCSGYCDIPFIFITAMPSFEQKLNCIRKGAVYYMAKPFVLSELQAKIESVLINRRNQLEFIKSSFISFIDQKKTGERKDESSGFNYALLDKFKLSKRESQIIVSLCEGKAYKEIAYDLNISEKTVSTFVQRIYRKTKVNSRIEIFQIFCQ